MKRSRGRLAAFAGASFIAAALLAGCTQATPGALKNDVLGGGPPKTVCGVAKHSYYGASSSATYYGAGVKSRNAVITGIGEHDFNVKAVSGGGFTVSGVGNFRLLSIQFGPSATTVTANKKYLPGLGKQTYRVPAKVAGQGAIRVINYCGAIVNPQKK